MIFASMLYILLPSILSFFFFFFNDTATTEIYTLSLHDALPIYELPEALLRGDKAAWDAFVRRYGRSEEHTSELQSPMYLVCRLLLEKKKKKNRDDSKEINTQIEPTSKNE